MNKIAFAFMLAILVKVSSVTSQKKTNTQVSCYDRQICGGTCNFGNSKGKCGTFYDGDFMDCTCLYCRIYKVDNTTNECDGKCESLAFTENRCISRVKNPEQDSDCTCTRCKIVLDLTTRKYKCTGNCGNGKKCKFGTSYQYFLSPRGSKPVETCQCTN